MYRCKAKKVGSKTLLLVVKLETCGQVLYPLNAFSGLKPWGAARAGLATKIAAFLGWGIGGEMRGH